MSRMLDNLYIFKIDEKDNQVNWEVCLLKQEINII